MRNRMFVLALITVLTFSSLSGCTVTRRPPDPAVPKAVPPTAAVPPPLTAPFDRSVLAQDAVALGFAFIHGQATAPAPRPAAYSPAAVRPAVPAFTVAADLGNLANRAQFPDLTPAQQGLLTQNGFFAAPTDFIQPFFLYENNTYLDVPSFITTDAVLHTHHLFFDWAMRGVEYFQLYPDIVDLTQRLLSKAQAAYAEAATPLRQQAALNAVIYFGVAARLLNGEASLPAAATAAVDAELQRIAAHQGRNTLSFLPFQIDYTAFIPRGHYTRTERFKQYFQAMTWYGLVPFPLPDPGQEPGPGHLAATRTALLITSLLGPEEEKLWRNVYEATALFVGLADDATPLQYRNVVTAAMMADLESDAVVRAFIRKALAELPPPGIRQQLANIPTGPQMRFMGQRFVLDSAVLQELVKFPERTVPTGLDLAAAWGSARARDMLLNERQEGQKWAEYPARLAQQVQRVAVVPQTEWQSNLYRGWLWTFQPLLQEKPAGYPAFMLAPAWTDKGINTVLGSWTQLRHDTILYVKPSAAQCGGDENIPPPPPGYVEPEPEFYARLEWLVQNSLAELSGRGLLDESMREQYVNFAEMLKGLKEVAVKELNGQALTRAEQDRIRFFGAALERLSIRVSGGFKGWFELTSEADKEMAVVADVHVAGDTVLEEAVGRPSAIFVAFPAEGRVWLGRGAIYSHFEFLQPAADRLTDEKWLARVQSHQTPPPPAWTRSFLTADKIRTAEPATRVVVPCGGNGSGGEDPG